MYEIELVTYLTNDALDHAKQTKARNAVLTTEFVETTRKTASTTNADSTLNTSTQTQDNANQQGKKEPNSQCGGLVDCFADNQSGFDDIGIDICQLELDQASDQLQTSECSSVGDWDIDALSLDSSSVRVDWGPDRGTYTNVDKASTRCNRVERAGYQAGLCPLKLQCSPHQPKQDHNRSGYTMTTLNTRVASEPSFTSYIDLQPESELDSQAMNVTADLLPGEICVSKADRVCSYSTVSGLTSGMSGTLFVTTLKLSLKLHLEDELRVRSNKILGPWDIPLSSIYAVYEIVGEGEKKKRLSLGTSVNTKVDGIFVVCKNFRFHRFSFKFAKIDQGRNVVNALLHHIRPKKNNLLFAFDHNTYTSIGSTPTKSCWESLRKMSHVKNVRVSRANENWQMSHSLPQQFIVPGHVTDEKLGMLAGLFMANRPPVWVWGTPEGGALFLQPNLSVLPSLQIDQLRDDYYGVTKGRVVKEIDLERILPFQSSVEESYATVLELHCIESEKEADKIDHEYFSRLENSGWLLFVSKSLRTSMDVCERLWNRETVVLIEGEARGYSILVASIVEILLEPDFRTRQGLEQLIENNWVSLGYPFSVNHQLSSPKTENNVVPIFLLFLDCVFQLTEQFPSQFDFRPEYLIDLWDTALLPVFDTFIFDSEHDRAMARRNPETPLNPSPAWNWESQFSPQYIKSWDNPLYGIPRRPERLTLQEPSPYSMIMDKQICPGVPENKKFLPVNPSLPALTTWLTLFHRSVNFLQRSDENKEEILALQRDAKIMITNMYSTNHQNHKSSGRNNISPR